MGSRPILGANTPEKQPQSSSGTAGSIAAAATALPLATELPPWDLLPSDSLLVRRRPASK
jgi:hypothetical protein